MPSAIITGSRGFIGRHLTKQLLDNGWAVGTINRSEGGGDLREDGIYFDLAWPTHLPPPSFKDHFGDSTDVLVHLAGPTTHDEIMLGDSFTHMRACAESIRHICKLNGVKRLIYASSGKVYSPSSAPLTETSPTCPTTFLGHMKLAAEQIMQMIGESLGIEVVIARLFNVYGPGQKDSFLIPTILNQLRGGNDTITLGNLAHKRDFIDVVDVVSAIMELAKAHWGDLAAVKSVIAPDTKALIANVGYGRAISVGEVVADISRQLDRDVKIRINREEAHRRAIEAEKERADCKILRQLGWAPRIALCTGLHFCIKHYLGKEARAE
jgi:nucleoside-diphosphate-sugar epimerase